MQNIHTIFGKVTGETIYNLLKLNESQTDANERPLYPHKINKIKILHNPFEDLEPRVDRRKDDIDKSKEAKRKPTSPLINSLALITNSFQTNVKV